MIKTDRQYGWLAYFCLQCNKFFNWDEAKCAKANHTIRLSVAKKKDAYLVDANDLRMARQLSRAPYAS